MIQSKQAGLTGALGMIAYTIIGTIFDVPLILWIFGAGAIMILTMLTVNQYRKKERAQQ